MLSAACLAGRTCLPAECGLNERSRRQRTKEKRREKGMKTPEQARAQGLLEEIVHRKKAIREERRARDEREGSGERTTRMTNGRSTSLIRLRESASDSTYCRGGATVQIKTELGEGAQREGEHQRRGSERATGGRFGAQGKRSCVSASDALLTSCAK